MSLNKCFQCGAPIAGLICQHCGATCGSPQDISKQQQALDEYHKHLRNQDKEGQARFLKAGFIPDYAKLLIDAGLVCVSFISDDALDQGRSEAAVSRLEAIIMKIQLLPLDSETKKATTMLQKRLKQYKRAQTRYGIFGLIGIFLIIVFIIFVIWWLKP